MPTPAPSIRVVVRLPYNRPEEPRPNPPRVEWNSEKEHMLWEVIAKSRVMEGGATDWTGLAAHLQVPLPYLLYRAQTRYEADLRGLQGIRGAFSPTITSPHAQIPANSTSGPTVTPTRTGPANVNGEYFPRFPNNDTPGLSRRDSLRTGNGNMSSSVSGRQLGIRTRLSSLGGQQSQIRSRRFNSTSSHATKKPCSSSILTLQGQKKTPRPGVRTLSPARGSPAGLASPNDASSEESSEEERDIQEEEERRQEEQNALDKKLKDLQRMMTKETLGLVSSPTPQRAFPVKVQTDIPRNRPLSASSTSSSFRHRGLDLSRRINTTPGQSQSPSQHSLSSTSSPHGSVPSIPSPPAENRTQPISVGKMARHLSPQTNRTSPPAISTRNAMGYNARQNSIPTPSRTRLAGELGSERGSEASSFSDLSMSDDADLSASALGSALMSDFRSTGSRASSYVRGQFSSRRPNGR